MNLIIDPKCYGSLARTIGIALIVFAAIFHSRLRRYASAGAYASTGGCRSTGACRSTRRRGSTGSAGATCPRSSGRPRSPTRASDGSAGAKPGRNRRRSSDQSRGPFHCAKTQHSHHYELCG